MKRLVGALFLGVLVLSGAFAQSTWRGQAEVWRSASVPADGYYAASNDFPKNTVVTVENYKTRKTIQVRIVAPLPAGSSAMLLVSVKAADALEMRVGESTLVGAQMDTSIDSFKSVARDDRPTNPDPDVNPIVRNRDEDEDETAAVAIKPVETPQPIASALPVASPAARPVASENPSVSPKTPTDPATLAAIDSTTKIDPALRPQVAELTPKPTPEAKQPVAEAIPEIDTSDAPLTAGRRVFIPPRPTDSVGATAEAWDKPSVPDVAVAETSTEPQESELPQVSPRSPQLSYADVDNPSELPSSPTATALAVEDPATSDVEKVSRVAEAPEASSEDGSFLPPTVPTLQLADDTEEARRLALKEPQTGDESLPVEKPTFEKPEAGNPVVDGSKSEKPIASTPTALTPLDVPSKTPLVKPEAHVQVAVLPPADLPPADVSSAGAFVSTPSPLKGPLLGRLNVLTHLEKGKPYVQIASFADEKTLVKEMERVKSYVPLSVFFNPAEKSPYRLMVASVPNAQLGVLLMHFKSQGYKSAVVVKG